MRISLPNLLSTFSSYIPDLDVPHYSHSLKFPLIFKQKEQSYPTRSQLTVSEVYRILYRMLYRQMYQNQCRVQLPAIIDPLITTLGLFCKSISRIDGL